MMARNFYLVLAHHLSRTSGFADSRRGVLRSGPRQREMLATVVHDFEAVDIVDAN